MGTRQRIKQVSPNQNISVHPTPDLHQPQLSVSQAALESHLQVAILPREVLFCKRLMHIHISY